MLLLDNASDYITRNVFSVEHSLQNVELDKSTCV